ncbi:hypothetical protein EJB05_45938, partial [Eragrostis curvula]
MKAGPPRRCPSPSRQTLRRRLRLSASTSAPFPFASYAVVVASAATASIGSRERRIRGSHCGNYLQQQNMLNWVCIQFDVFLRESLVECMDILMASEDSKDILKNVDWKTVGGSVTTESSQPVVKKRLPKKIRQVPDCYFLPRRSWPSALGFYGAVCAAGVGAGMLLERMAALCGRWINDVQHV